MSRAITFDAPRVGPPPILSNAAVGMWLFLVSEVMFFVGLIGAFIVLRFSAGVWPPDGAPRLPVGLTACNTLVLLASSAALQSGHAALRRGHRRGLSLGIFVTVLLGGTFLTIQGWEWAHLHQAGLTLTSSLYGSSFYTLTGCHGLHVLAGLVLLLVVGVRSLAGHYTPDQHDGVVVVSLFWHFVDGVWLILFWLIYLL